MRRSPLIMLLMRTGMALGLLMMCAMTAGAQWKRVNLPGHLHDEIYLDVMFLPSQPQYGWACSYDGYLVRTIDGGNTWTGVHVPGALSSQTGPALESVCFLTPTRGYTSGPAGIWATVDGGVNWTDITPDNLSLTTQGWGCYFYSQLEGVYLAGGCIGDGQHFYRTTDGGNHWTKSTYDIPGSGLSDAIIYPSGRGYASSSGLIWATDDYGMNWRIFTTTGIASWQEEITNKGASFLVPNAGHSCNGGDADIGELRFTTDNGKSWQVLKTNASMFGTFLLDERRGWGVGMGELVYYTADAGKTWELRNCGVTTDIDDVWFINDTLGWLAGRGLYRSNFGVQPNPLTLIPTDPVIYICEGETVNMSGSLGLTDYRWMDTDLRFPVREIGAAGTYILSAFETSTCRRVYDTVTVVMYPRNVPQVMGARKVLCYGDSVDLQVSGPFTRIEWNTNDTVGTITAKTSGNYYVTTIDTNGCTQISEEYIVTIKPPIKPRITANNRLTICMDDSVMLSAPQGYAHYIWSDGSTNRDIVVRTEGRYAVHVIDADGCEGTSDTVQVTVLQIRNKVEVVRSGTGEVVIPDHAVGTSACVDITIRNVSESENLVLSAPWLVGNVFFSIPLSQLPIIVAPQQSQTLRVCAAAIDSGFVRDTLVVPDTCSPSYVPLVSYGGVIPYTGISRCNAPVQATVFRAGTSYQLFPVWPSPAEADVVHVTIMVPTGTPSPTGMHAYVIDALGRASLRDIGIVPNSDTAVNVGTLVPGAYSVVLMDGQETLGTLPFIVAP